MSLYNPPVKVIVKMWRSFLSLQIRYTWLKERGILKAIDFFSCVYVDTTLIEQAFNMQPKFPFVNESA